MQTLSAALRCLLLVVTILVFLVPMVLTWLAGPRRVYERLLQIIYRVVAWTWRIRIQQIGEFTSQRPVLIVSNHQSYLDIPVLGAILPVHFTPKSEIAKWPVIGTLCKIAGCVFIDRRREATVKNKDNLRQQLSQPIAISLFPEGTTSDGTALLPFRSSFFSLVTDKEIPHLVVQPVSISYLRKDGNPFTAQEMAEIAWFGDAEFFPHLWHYLKLPGVLAQVTVHPLIDPAPDADRKALAEQASNVVASAYIPARKE
jgi:lyso-ornithine lipid O-acyltransferase